MGMLHISQHQIGRLLKEVDKKDQKKYIIAMGTKNVSKYTIYVWVLTNLHQVYEQAAMYIWCKSTNQNTIAPVAVRSSQMLQKPSK